LQEIEERAKRLKFKIVKQKSALKMLALDVFVFPASETIGDRWLEGTFKEVPETCTCDDKQEGPSILKKLLAFGPDI
jgi:hypothetical protein